MKANRRNQRIDGLIAVLAIAMAAPAATLKAQDGGYPNGNTAEGDFALAEIISHPSDSGINNVAIGASALNSDNSGSHNTAVGSDALSNNDSGNNNTATGDIALENNTSGADNTATGSGALGQNTIGNDNTATGFEVLLHNTSGTANTASGLHAMQFNTTGSDNTGSGLIALQSNTTGAENAAFGAFALATNTTGKNNTAEGSGALANATTGSNNVAVGFDAGLNLKSGGNNIIIGANVPGTAADANTIRIGKQGTQKSTFVAGIFGTAVTGSTVVVNSTGKLGVATSSARFKEAIKPMDKASNAILALKPITFRYKEEVDPDHAPQFGLVAEEVEKVDPELVIHDEEGKPFTVRYEAVNAMLLNEFLKEHHRVGELQAAGIAERKEIAELNQQLKAQAAAIQKMRAQFRLSKSTSQTVAETR
jgi:Chaperone of endosialidase